MSFFTKKEKKKRTVIQIVMDTIINIVMVAALLLFVLAIVTVFNHKDNPNEAFLLGYKPVYVMTGSMEPTLRVNGVVIIKKAEYDEINIDDIVMYEIDDKMITHRVVEITDDGIRTKGDNNNVQDAYLLQPENIRGKAVSIWNWTATVVNKWNSPQGRTQIIIIAIFIVCVFLLLAGIKIIFKSKKSSSEIEETQDPMNNSVPDKQCKTEPPSPRFALSEEEAAKTIYIPKDLRR